jgi:hypothetical protein
MEAEETVKTFTKIPLVGLGQFAFEVFANFGNETR